MALFWLFLWMAFAGGRFTPVPRGYNPVRGGTGHGGDPQPIWHTVGRG